MLGKNIPVVVELKLYPNELISDEDSETRDN